MHNRFPQIACALLAMPAFLATNAIADEVANTSPPEPVPLDMFGVPDDLGMPLWAQSPQLRQATHSGVEAAGRRGVAAGVDHRHREDRDPQGERVVVREDTEGGGRADRAATYVQEPAL